MAGILYADMLLRNHSLTLLVYVQLLQSIWVDCNVSWCHPHTIPNSFHDVCVGVRRWVFDILF